MAAASGPVRYLFLRREGPEREGEPADWPPPVLDVTSDDQACVALQVAATADGWSVTPLAKVPPLDAIPADTFVLSRDTALGLLLGRGDDVVALLAARAERTEPKEPERLTHLVVFPTEGALARRARPTVVPASAIVLSDFVERGGQTRAAMDLRLSAAELSELPPWLPDATLEGIASSVVDQAVLSARARHMLTLEVNAGRVAVHGRAELATSAQAAVVALEGTAGVLEVGEHILVDEQLTDAVERALAEKGITDVHALAEHGLISLHGEAPDAATRRQAEDIAARVTGVRGVVNRLAVRASV